MHSFVGVQKYVCMFFLSESMYACLMALVNCVAFYAITYLVKKRWLWVEVFEVVSFCNDLMFSWAMRTFLFLSRGSLFHILYPRISLMLMAT